MFRRLLQTSVLLGLLAFAYAGGAYSRAHNVWPMNEMRELKRKATGEASVLNTFDPIGRLIGHAGKPSVACPEQTPGTAVILFLGQSIQSNSAGQRYVSNHGERVLSFFDGRCSVAASPLLGSTEAGGEALTPIGNKLIESDTFERVVLVPFAVGSTHVSQWAPGGNLHPILLDGLARVSQIYKITHIVWHQGEEDFDDRTSSESYRRDFMNLLTAIRSHGISAPVFVSVASKCDVDYRWTADNPVTRAQRALPDPATKIYPGVDTDALIGDLDRYDGCHLGASGVQKYARATADLIAASRPR